MVLVMLEAVRLEKRLGSPLYNDPWDLVVCFQHTSSASSTSARVLVFKGDDREAIVNRLARDIGDSQFRKLEQNGLAGVSVTSRIADDVIARFGEDSKIKEISDAGVELFNHHWQIQILKIFFDERKIRDHIPYEQALQALHEHFVVEPVLRS